ncbi:Uu.00g087270.m01.CDS01 [Anthostomella pinea]|uniref:Uu.00g087270.m01.CDS01 n=1 Tax=Anthostomella pinea TaxID=933095 RepID=A0AAI8VN88_9PEZI|nr:Uu.00g087270.m01.CDS01 [Anthostomella pinea]
MDDPWGSPWASSDATTTSKHDTLPPSPPKSLLSPPPRAFFGNIANLPSHSPWADDDAFGDWAGAERTENTSSQGDWGARADAGAQMPQLSPKPDSSGKASPLAWPSSAATSPGLRPLPRSRASSVFRHHSLDPWATEPSLTEGPNLPPPTSPNAQVNATANTTTGPDEEDAISISIRGPGEGTTTVIDGPAFLDQQAETSKVDGKDEQGASEYYKDDGVLRPELDSHDPQSRPSSAFSDDSRNVPDRPDSPITSIDEDPKSRRQPISRKTSGKVQELVGMFDGLAKAIPEETPPPERHESLQVKRRERLPGRTESREDAESGFGDFEDASFDNRKVAPDSAVSLGRSSTPKARCEDGVSPDRESESNEPQAPISRSVLVRVQELIEKFGPVSYDVDLQDIDKLYPDLDEVVRSDASDAGEASQVPDQLIRDSFTTISERKTWYRISRYGPMRKHDSGDEDNYQRVIWSSSQLHTDTIKIVRRWMEEDSFSSGRPSLGGSKRTSAFNWDSDATAAPIDLDKVFARRPSAIAHARTVSIPPPKQNPIQTAPSLGSRPARDSTGGSVGQPGTTFGTVTLVANFGWSSDVLDSPTTAPPASIGTQAQNAPRRPSPIVPPPAAVTLPVPGEVHAGSEDDEEDDWGEMVSSPKVEIHPAIPAAAIRQESSSTLTTQVNSPAPTLSVAIPQPSQPSEEVSKEPPSPERKSAHGNPWPLADLSIFEKSAGTPKSSRQELGPVADFSIFESPTSFSKSSLVNSTKPNSVFESRDGGDGSAVEQKETDSPDTQVPAKPIAAILGPIEKSTVSSDQESIARNIVQNLPDLSYMLR